MYIVFHSEDIGR